MTTTPTSERQAKRNAAIQEAVTAANIPGVKTGTHLLSTVLNLYREYGSNWPAALYAQWANAHGGAVAAVKDGTHTPDS